MRGHRTAVWIGAFAWLVFFAALPGAAFAEWGANERDILQKGLTVFEIDQELARISTRQTQLASQLKDTESGIGEAERRAAALRQHAAQVARAYYMGDRDTVWMLLFSARSLTDAWSLWDYLQMILQNDRKSLQQHNDAALQLKGLKEKLAAEQRALTESKLRYANERARQTALQQELDRQLAASTEAQRLQQQLQAVNQQWKERGVPLFRSYFQALAAAMKQLTDLVALPASGTASGGSRSGNVTIHGLTSTFQLSDEELNTFLRQKNALFNDVRFRFAQDQVVASGRQDDLDFVMKGSYQLAVNEKSNKPYIRFQIDELQFNGLTLPGTTVQDLQESFDLGIYPQTIAPFLQATGVKLDEGRLTITLKLAL